MNTGLLSRIQSFREEMKKSQFKIWLRIFLFLQFSAIFSYYFFRDIGNGYFSWKWVAILFTLFIPVGFLMSLIVPMKADLELGAVTLSLDRVYLFLIWLLVIAKLIIGRIPQFIPEADFIMCSILGIMFGRLVGIGLRVHRLKMRHSILTKEPSIFSSLRKLLSSELSLISIKNAKIVCQFMRVAGNVKTRHYTCSL